jgi:hypothetical protein
MWKRPQIFNFYRAVYAEVRLGWGYKLLTVLWVALAAFSTYLTFADKIADNPLMPPQAFKQVWSRVWPFLFVLLVVYLLLLILVAVHRYHTRVVGELKTEHRADLTAQSRTHTDEIEGLKTEHGRSRSRLEREIESLKDRVGGLKSQLDERNKDKVIFELGPQLNNRVFVSRNSSFKVEDFQPVQYDSYVIKAVFRVRFANHTLHRVAVRDMKMSLVRLTRGGRGDEKEIPLWSSNMESYEEGSSTKVKWDGSSEILEGRTTPYYEVHSNLCVGVEYGKRLNQNCFLRLTMDAMRQLPYHVDFSVDWEWARGSSEGVFLTPRK